MESNTTNLESDSKTSSEEESMDVVGRPESAAARSYECVFCKRGFTTAQALGGHMNIHRKDRAKSGNRHGNSRSVADDEPHFNFFSPPIQTLPAHYYSMFQQVNTSFFPAGSWGLVGPPSAVEGTRTCLNLIGDDWPASLSLRIGPPSMDEEDHDKKFGEDGLDLELRLGHDP